MEIVTLSSSSLTVLVDAAPPVPAVLWWGPAVGGTPATPDALAALIDRPAAPASLDSEAPMTLLPSGWDGFPGHPGIELVGPPGSGPLRGVEIECDSDRLSFRAAGTGFAIEGTLVVGDVLTVSLAVRNESDAPLGVQGLRATLPLPADCDELLRFDGRWCKEFSPTRSGWTGTEVIENRRGRTSHDRVPVAFVGPSGFGEAAGVVRGLHVAWSGNSGLRFEHLADGRAMVQAGEILLPGEVTLEPGQEYRAPTVLAVAGTGLGEASDAFHRHLRAGLPERPRPVVLNTWEAVYFDHDRDTLFALAEAAADVGVERFVLDDGWFGGRRDDTAGLGDWWVSADAHPDGLDPLIDHVRGLGMEFGIWVEPEMVNPDSDLYRTHPEWVLGNPELTGRNQLVLDLGNPACWDHLFTAIDSLLRLHRIDFVKWDMNRDVVGAGAHVQTHALYRLLAALRDAHPDVEIESCASGGGRADAGILAHTCRIWTSDCNDPLERQTIQRGFSHLFPPEVMGAHIGPPRAHTTGRQQRLAFRAATALFGHLGIEWNLLEASDRHRDALRRWIALYRELRPLLHGGTTVRIDPVGTDALAHGVVSRSRDQAVFCHAQLTTSVQSLPPRLVLRGLDPDREYRIAHIATPGEVFGFARRPRWMDEPVRVPGRALMSVGVQLPALHPESAVLFRLDT